MKSCTGIYSHKGFTISFSETYQEWVAEPNFLIDEFGDDVVVINFINEHSYDIPPQKTITALKKEINSYINKGIKEELKSIYEEEIKNEKL